jgi:hypothetical protein
MEHVERRLLWKRVVDVVIVAPTTTRLRCLGIQLTLRGATAPRPAALPRPQYHPGAKSGSDPRRSRSVHRTFQPALLGFGETARSGHDFDGEDRPPPCRGNVIEAVAAYPCAILY